MEKDKKNKTLSKSANIAGYSLLLMTVLSIVIFHSLKANTLSIIGIAIIIILDVIVAWGLYEFFKPVSQRLSLVTAAFRIIYAFFFALALTQISNHDSFYSIWDKSLILFGFHLFTLGILTIKASYVPQLLAYLVTLASIGYIVDGIGKLVGYSSNLAMLVFFGEVFLGFWLVVKGRKVTIN